MASLNRVKAYDCTAKNVSTTAFSLLAPDTCIGVAAASKYERQLSLEMIQVKGSEASLFKGAW